MTSEIDNLKTNDILRRRKLRLQQVREQSKNIAKKVRLRTSEEKLRQINKETSQREQELLNVQDKFVKELKEYYIQGIKNVGEGHKQASLAKEQGSPPKEDLSKSRGKAAVAELRKRKQQKLDIQKKVLDRKLQARDVANEISREKHNSVGGKLSSKTSVQQASDTNTVPTAGGDDNTKPAKDNNDNEIELAKPQSTHCNMATQWEMEETLQEWNPTVPSLPLPIDEDPKDTDRAPSNSKKFNLFTLSDDMPNSLRGGLINTSSTYEKVRPSLTLVTEYLQARATRLREPASSVSSKKPLENLDDIKQTIIRTRSTRNEVAEKQSKISEQGVSKKPSVTMYNHSTKDTRDIPYEDASCVMRDQLSNEDAFTQAMRHKATELTQSNQENNIQTMRSKVAISKVNVEKEYKDTMHFLNTVHKNKAGKPIIKNVYKDDEQLHESHIIHQRKLEREYKKMVKEHKRHTCRKSNHNKSKGYTQNEVENELDNDFEYSWMPIPESDDNLAIHTIPTTKPPKTGNTVKFNKVDGYHEYRSRHKHTPPTKDASHTKSNRKVVEAVFVEDIESSVANETDTGSAETLTPEPVSKVAIENKYVNTSDADRIIIYKIIESKKSKKDKKSTSTHEGRKTQTDCVAKEPNHQSSSPNKAQKCDAIIEVPLENLKEGLYKTVADKGTNVSMMAMNANTQAGDAVTSLEQANQPTCKNAPLQWEIGDKPPQELKATEPCNCGQLSSTTSATSLKTPNKVNDIKNPEGGGYIKVVDDDGQEAGKFYIGASGILHDNAYEVVFQVRKKDGKKSDPEKAPEKSTEPVIENDAQPVESGLKKKQDVRKSPKGQSLPAENTNNIPKTQPQPPNEVKTQDAMISVDVGNGNNQNNFAVDKGISKSIQVESCVISNKDPVKSIFTQTSFSSPVERQAYIQMSSSASTSYMSPPDKILPIFMRNRHNKPEYCVRQENCRCRKCASRKPGFKQNENCNEFARNLVTPPNTARSHFEALDYSGSEHETKKKKHRCRKAHSQKEKKRKKSADSRHSLPSNREVWDNLMLQFTSETTSSQTTNAAKGNKSKPNLNPLIKTYIDHLLSLNSESLKAIEVVNLQCSSVSTPGSSIIEVPHNARDSKSKNNIEKKISLEQIKKYIEKQLIEKLQERNNNSRNELTKIKSKSDVYRKNNVAIPKKKQVHKVKSLNISKTVLKSLNTSLSKKNSNRSCSKTVNSVSPMSTGKICRDVKQPQYIERSSKTKNKREPLKSDQHKQKKSSKLPSPIPSVETMVSGIPMRSEVTISPINKGVKETQQIPVNTSSTQTNKPIENELSFIKIAENKLQNMEKIADLTEKCTNRLSNLAKVLEEVRKNKCVPYLHGSTDDVTSSSDNLVEKTPEIYDEVKHKVTQYSHMPTFEGTDDSKNPFTMTDIRESSQRSSDSHRIEKHQFANVGKTETNSEPLEKDPIDQDHLKSRSKPPPAFTNYGKYYVTPHELSTVVEVDSPMSLNINKIPSSRTSTEELVGQENKEAVQNLQSKEYINPDIIQNNSSKNKNNEDSKHPMLDLNQFNKIMLQPFLSIQEYAKDVNVVSVDETSNVEDFTIQQKEGSVIVAPDDVSSLHSDGSLPDVVSELLKRKLIAEPFKFDSPSNNSTTVSSDSTLSILKIKTTSDKRKPNHNKENMAESSDSISISSNPDLENAFKKLGMGWASSTLKKTKERLALSSSSNTSSSSLSQFKIKPFNQEIPALVTDSISSVTNVSRKKLDKSKNAEQQTLISNSMTVKEFLTTELAKKITFTKKPNRNEQTEEFVSLYETKIPEELKDNSQAPRDCSLDHSQNGNRARTSTPVQIFKSMTYHSSSNSNTSNGLFSNADDLSSVKGSNSIRNHSTSDKDDLTIPNYSLKMRKSPDETKSD